MSLLKYVERLKKMDDLILNKATGNADEFAKKMNVSPSQIFKEIKDMKVLGAPIEYSYEQQSYLYSKNCRMVLDFIVASERIEENKQESSLATSG